MPSVSSELKIEVTAKPLARRTEVRETAPGRYRVAVTERAVEGRANEAVREALAGHFGVPRSRVRLLQGAKHKVKRYEIDGL